MKISLQEDMAADPRIVALCEDPKIAADFYSALCNVVWEKKVPLPEDEQIIATLKGLEPTTWSCSWRFAGGIIAGIRNEHYNIRESYLDFYCSGNEGNISKVVEECFNRLHWFVRPDL
jgi:hypothetical protein